MEAALELHKLHKFEQNLINVCSFVFYLPLLEDHIYLVTCTPGLQYQDCPRGGWSSPEDWAISLILYNMKKSQRKQ